MIVPIFLDPERFPVSQGEFRSMDKVLLRTLDIMKEETLRNDYEMAQPINLGAQVKQEILEKFADDPTALKKLKKIFCKKEFNPLLGPEKRLIKIITGLRPDKPLTEDSLHFDHEEMRIWVKLGEEKAQKILKESPFI